MDQTAQNEASAVREAIESLDPGLYPCQLLARLWYAFLARGNCTLHGKCFICRGNEIAGDPRIAVGFKADGGGEHG